MKKKCTVKLQDEIPATAGIPFLGKIRLIANWRRVLYRAWTVKFIVLAGVLTGIEAILPLFQLYGWIEWFPGGVFALVTFFVVLGAFFTRIIAQKSLHGPATKN